MLEAEKTIDKNIILQERFGVQSKELRLDAPVVARFVKYHITPARIVCLSELQILDRVTYTPFDIRIALPTVP